MFLNLVRSSKRRKITKVVDFTHSLHHVEEDYDDTIVFIDLEEVSLDSLQKLQLFFQSNSPTYHQCITRLQNCIPFNCRRISIEIDFYNFSSLFTDWFLTCYKVNDSLQKMLNPILLDEKVIILGCQWIIPYSLGYEEISQQKPHTDIDSKQKVFCVAFNVYGNHMDTIIDPSARSSPTTIPEFTENKKKASTSCFIYDTGVVHAGPKPNYSKNGLLKEEKNSGIEFICNRVFVLLTSPRYNSDELHELKLDNGLESNKIYTIQMI